MIQNAADDAGATIIQFFMDCIYRQHVNTDLKTVSFECKCGEEIPESHQAWLKQDPHNIFPPMEYVGYEDKDGHIIVAQVVRLVSSVEDNKLTKVYLIFTGIEDNE